MKLQKIQFENISCHFVANPSSNNIAYIIYPLDVLDDWIANAAEKYRVSIAVITGMDWDNALTPWPAPGVPKGTPNFKGLASQFLKTITQTIAPEVEKRIGLTNDFERTLVGVSLSGLFALWQWAQSDYFKNIATLSGSYWYANFVEWIWQQTFREKSGSCYMLLGEDEPKSPNPIFRTVGKCTDKIVTFLREQGVDITFNMVPGNHYQYGLQRLDKAFTSLFK